MKNQTERLPLGPVAQGNQAVLPPVAAKTMPVPEPRAPEFTFTFKRHISGHFPGLWELVKVNADGEREVLIDADNLSSCLDTVQGFFEGAGL